MSASASQRRHFPAALAFWCTIFAAVFEPHALLAGEVLTIETKVADARIDPKTKESVIFVKLTDESKRLVAELTQRNIGKTLEFRVDGTTVMKALIHEPLLAGVFEIIGKRNLDEARQVAKKMSTFGTKIEIEVVD